MKQEQQLKITVIQKSVLLSGPYNKDFDELELAKTLNLTREEVLTLIRKEEFRDFFSVAQKSVVKCPKCKSNTELGSNLDYSFCEKCNQEFDLNKVGLYTIGLKRAEVETYLTEYLGGIFQESGHWKIRDSDNNFLIMKENNQLIAFSISLNESGLKDYFLLRGWAMEYFPESFILISLKFDKFLSLYKDKDLKCIIIPFEKIFEKDFIKSTLDEVKKRKEAYDKEKRAEGVIDFEFKKFGELSELADNLNELLRYLPARALQKGPESASRKGNKFQKDIIRLLNLSILSSKYAGGPNQPDGISFIFREGNREKSEWFPLEIKTFKPASESARFYPLSEVVRQVDKYYNSFDKQEIREIATIRTYIVIAYDFDINSKTEKEIIESFQNKYHIKLILFPLNSLVKILNNFIKKEIFYLPKDDVKNFLLKSNYISEQQVDDFFNELEKHNKDKFKEQMKTIRDSTKKQGR